MRIREMVVFIVVAGVGACDGGGSGGTDGGDFRLIQFLDNNRADIDRNHAVTFLFSAPVAPGQDLPQRLKIQSVETGQPSDFTLAIGSYVVTGDRVTFVPPSRWRGPGSNQVQAGVSRVRSAVTSFEFTA